MPPTPLATGRQQWFKGRPTRPVQRASRCSTTTRGMGKACRRPEGCTQQQADSNGFKESRTCTEQHSHSSMLHIGWKQAEIALSLLLAGSGWLGPKHAFCTASVACHNTKTRNVLRGEGRRNQLPLHLSVHWLLRCKPFLLPAAHQR